MLSSAGCIATAWFMGPRSGGRKVAEMCGCAMTLGCQIKSSFGFYFEMSLCLKCSSTHNIFRCLITEYDQFVQPHGSGLADSPAWPALCFRVLCFRHLPQHVKGTVRELGTCKRALSPVCDNLDNSSLFSRFVRMLKS